MSLKVISVALMAHHGKKGSRSDATNVQPLKRRVVSWNQERAVTFSEQEFLGTLPAFSVNDFSRICRVSQNDCKTMIRNHFYLPIPIF